MANLVVVVEVRGMAATGPSLFAVSEARRVAGELGATVYALLPLPAAGAASLDALAAGVGRAGADRVLCCTSPALDAGPLDAVVGPLLCAVAERLRPILTLLPAGRIGLELGPPLAARTGAVLHAPAALDCALTGGAPRLLVRRRRPDGAERVIDLAELERPVVATLAAGSPSATGAPAADVEELPLPAGAPPRVRVVERAEDPGGAADLAALLVVGRAGAPPATALPGAAVVAAPPPGACPFRLLILGEAPPGLRPSPDTRVAIVGPKGTDARAPRADLVWRASPAEAAGALATLVGTP